MTAPPIFSANEDYDPEAPYGRNPRTGMPYKRSPEERAALGERLQQGRRNARGEGAGRASAPPPRASSSKPTTAGPGYAKTVLGLAQLPTFALMGLSRKWPIMAAHAQAVQMHAGPIALAIEEIAIEDERWGAALDSVAKMGPYGALVSAAIPLFLQIGANMGVVPIVDELGIVDPITLLQKAGFDVRAPEPASDPAPASGPGPAEHVGDFPAF